MLSWALNAGWKQPRRMRRMRRCRGGKFEFACGYFHPPRQSPNRLGASFLLGVPVLHSIGNSLTNYFSNYYTVILYSSTSIESYYLFNHLFSTTGFQAVVLVLLVYHKHQDCYHSLHLRRAIDKFFQRKALTFNHSSANFLR